MLKKILVDVPEEVHFKIKSVALQRRSTLRDCVIEALVQWVERYYGKEG